MTVAPARRGFTLMELLIVMIVIGVLAAIAVARFGTAKERAYRITMESDLRNLMSAQLAFHGSQEPPLWAQSLAELGDRFKPSAGVTVTMPNVTGTGFGAIARHSATRVRCAVFVGDAVTPPATLDGQIACE